MNKRLKVLHVINSLLPGGAENLLVNSLAPGGLQDHVDNYLVYLNDDSYLLKKIDSQVKIFNLGYKHKLTLFNALKKLRKIIVENNIDIIHSHLSPAGFYTAIAKPKNIPQVHTFHNTYSVVKKAGNQFLNYLEKKFLLERKNAQLIMLSQFHKEDIVSAINFKGNAYVLNNFIDDLYFKNEIKKQSSNRLKVIAVGNLRPEKNYSYLIDIFKHLKEENILLDVYGIGNTDKYLKKLEQNNIDNVHFKGNIQNLYEIIKNYDLFIMASKIEGFPLSVFEAMVSGIPVLLSDIPVFKNLVQDNALYFSLSDPMNAVKILKQILSNEKDINTLAAKAKIFAEGLVKKEIYIQKLLEIYKQALYQNKNFTVTDNRKKNN